MNKAEKQWKGALRAGANFASTYRGHWGRGAASHTAGSCQRGISIRQPQGPCVPSGIRTAFPSVPSPMVHVGFFYCSRWCSPFREQPGRVCKVPHRIVTPARRVPVAWRRAGSLWNCIVSRAPDQGLPARP